MISNMKYDVIDIDDINLFKTAKDIYSFLYGIVMSVVEY